MGCPSRSVLKNTGCRHRFACTGSSDKRLGLHCLRSYPQNRGWTLPSVGIPHSESVDFTVYPVDFTGRWKITDLRISMGYGVSPVGFTAIL